MKTPRQIKFTEAGLAALKIIQQDKENQSNAVERALLIAAGKAVSAVPPKFRLLDPEAYLLLQAERTELEHQHREIKKDIMKIRGGDRESAQKIAAVVTKAEKEIEMLDQLRLRLANMAQTTTALKAEDVAHLKTLIGWAKNRATNTTTKPENLPVYELELRLLQAFLA